jgi:hypothetical protein
MRCRFHWRPSGLSRQQRLHSGAVRVDSSSRLHWGQVGSGGSWPRWRAR